MDKVLFMPYTILCHYSHNVQKKEAFLTGFFFCIHGITYGYIMIFYAQKYVTKKDFPKKVKE